jgi:hypothetical protein
LEIAVQADSSTVPTFSNAITPSPHSAAYAKLRIAAQAMRVLSAAYLVSVFWHIQDWWLDGERVARLVGNAYGKDLSAMQAWQRLAAMGVDLAALGLLVVAVVYCWCFLGTLQQKTSFTETGVGYLMRCAWWGSACEVFSLVSRPLKSYLLTLHLSPTDQQWRWSLQSGDVQSAILCVALLMFALMFSWALEIAEENRSFV